MARFIKIIVSELRITLFFFCFLIVGKKFFDLNGKFLIKNKDERSKRDIIPYKILNWICKKFEIANPTDF